jgi:hypothetical protein
MSRKSVTLLTEYRLSIMDTIREASELVLDLEIAVEEVRQLTPEQIRSTHAVWHHHKMKEITDLHSNLGKQLRKHKADAKKLKSFFINAL